MGHLCRTYSARSSFGLAYVSRIELVYAYNPINLFAIMVIAALPSAHHYVVQSEEEDLAADSFHSQVSLIEMLHGSHCCRECRVQIPYSNFTDMCELWLHLRCLQQCYCALLGRLGSEEEFLPSRNPCSSAHVGHHLSSPKMTSVLCHTTMSSLLEIPCQNPIEVFGHGLLVVQGARTVRTLDTCSKNLSRHRAWTWRC
jgi:hypothetical protein